MSKRFIDTTIWNDPWFRKLKPEHKCFWLYICTNCDNAGVWKVDYEMASFHIGTPVNNEVIELINNGKPRLKLFDSSSLLLIMGFIDFQVGKIVQNKHTNLQISSLNLIHKYVGNKGLTKDDFMLTGKLPVVYSNPTDISNSKGNSNGKGKSKSILNYKEGHLLNDEFKKVYEEYLTMRHQIRRPATLKAEQLVVEKLNRYDLKTAIAMLNQSIENSWQGIFPLKRSIEVLNEQPRLNPKSFG